MNPVVKKMKSTIENELTTLVYELPEELVRKIEWLRPPWRNPAISRHEIAKIIVDANREDKLRLNYLNKSNSNHCVWDTLRPFKIGSNAYGDDDAPMQIIRNNISIGEKMRLRALANQKC